MMHEAIVDISLVHADWTRTRDHPITDAEPELACGGRYSPPPSDGDQIGNICKAELHTVVTQLWLDFAQ
jgi:hypothetical protein